MENIRFFGKTFRTTLLFILLAELLSFFIYWFKIITDLNSVFFIITVLLIFIISLLDLKYGIYAALVELFIGSKGYLLALTIGNFSISIRIGIFCVVMLAWLILTLRKGLSKNIVQTIREHKELFWLALICIWGLVFALIRQNTASDIFLDFNAWIYFLYFLPFITVLTKNKHLSEILQIFTAAITAIAIKSCFFLFVFSHKLGVMHDFYKWGRDTGWGEFTLIKGGFYRIFSQGQIFVLIGFFIVIGYLFFKRKFDYRTPTNQYLAITLFLLLTTTILSLSRSFWLSLILSFILLLILALWKYKLGWKAIALMFMRLGFLTLLSYALIVAIMNFPISRGQGVSNSGSMITQRLMLTGDAISSRWSQLPELSKAIIAHPIVGSGWGATVTYQSQDPRILTLENPQGWYTTYAFEWGYIDIVLKIGLIGLAIYLILIWSIFRKYWELWKKNTDRYSRALFVGLNLGLFSLLIVHGFSPYLNHPLGIGYILILLVILNIYSNVEPTKA
ncbi:O-antigen ligase family protein [Candidatus Kuenenbacteria bacterium]|nr:O-antigen ligase family protein [Candidatus Kuenenbacteria bacterium]